MHTGRQRLVGKGEEENLKILVFDGFRQGKRENKRGKEPVLKMTPFGNPCLKLLTERGKRGIIAVNKQWKTVIRMTKNHSGGFGSEGVQK